MFNLKDKSGYTLTELIAVIAIMAVITGITVPWVMNTNVNATEANELARAFYYTLQNEIVNNKTAETVVSAGFLIYMEVSKNSCSVTIKTSDDVYYRETDSFETKLADVLERCFENSGKSGFFFGFIDLRLRVVRTYWCENFDVIMTYFFKPDSESNGFNTETDIDVLLEMMPNNIEKNTGTLIGTFPYLTSI